MSYSEKRTIVSILVGIVVLASYCFYVYGKVKAGVAESDNIKFWAGAMLIFVGIGIISSIIIQIVFHILLSMSMAVREQIATGQSDGKKIEKMIASEMVTDEMDKLVELKSLRVGFAIAGVGFMTALIFAYLGHSPAVMLNIMFVSFSVGSIIEGFSTIFYYRRGVTRG
ncbi:MAG: hypothetical protein GXY06_06185 [Clostridiaceae bacterium]|nr:hypothetical protein [Clostridiaceae bacterium]